MFVMCTMDYWLPHESNNTTAGEKLGLYLVVFVVVENVGFVEFADSVAAVGKVGFVVFVDFVESEQYFDYSLKPNCVPNPDRACNVHDCGKNYC